MDCSFSFFCLLRIVLRRKQEGSKSCSLMYCNQYRDFVGRRCARYVHFKYCNVSKKTVRISKLTTSCGCTVAKCNKDLVQPGERGEINLIFHPKDQAGDLYREAFVYTDLSGKKPMIRLVLTGKVSPTSDNGRDIP